MAVTVDVWTHFKFHNNFLTQFIFILLKFKIKVKNYGQFQGPYLQNFTFFIAYERAQLPRGLCYNKPEMIARDKLSRLLGPFISYKENELLWIWLLCQMLLKNYVHDLRLSLKAIPNLV